MTFVVETAEEIDLFEQMYADPEMRPLIDAWVRKKYPGIDMQLEIQRLRQRWPKRSR